MTQEQVSSGTWIVDPGKQEAFIEAWAAFAGWSSGMPGVGTLRLGRDPGDARRFVSFAAWESAEAAGMWQRAPEFQEKLANAVQHVDEFHSTMFDVVASGADGSGVVDAS